MSNSKKISTNDKLLMAAIDLFAEKGYKGVTTQEIATSAGLSEKTLFRHFGCKQNLLETAVERFHYTEEMTKLFNEKIVWDLQTDLLLISRTYHKIMNKNRKMIMISIKEEENLPGFRERKNKPPLQLFEILSDYFSVMIEKGKIVKTNPDVQAFSFMAMNYGAFLNNLETEINFPSVSLENFITVSVQTVTRALTP
ncbi:TetR/AcrR family transcriptional regulator [Niallia sp. Man26]|uniref:TetR/AcrR family transcriptional regulator n=1 Tax=Niallia sp. Man26 TaxID=2912824 RepID=UPI001EDA41D0|nr:TetR/AcrR family transcriptional regulator [Niallia sp. Man26]UPO90167.1 TetR/AcrR family transcriptional regulator [Niallia sp. Man26]